MKFKKSLPFLFILLISAYSIFGLFFSLNIAIPDTGDFLISFLQAFVSSALVLLLGAVGGLSLAAAKGKLRILFIFLALIPQLLPSNIFMSSLLVLTSNLDIEFKGFWAVIYAHLSLNTGFCSLLFYNLYRRYLRNIVDVTSIFELSFKKRALLIFRSGLLKEVSKLFHFSFSFTV